MWQKISWNCMRFIFPLPNYLVLERTGKHFSCSRHISWKSIGVWLSLQFFGHKLIHWLWSTISSQKCSTWGANLRSYIKYTQSTLINSVIYSVVHKKSPNRLNKFIFSYLFVAWKDNTFNWVADNCNKKIDFVMQYLTDPV